MRMFDRPRSVMTPQGEALSWPRPAGKILTIAIFGLAAVILLLACLEPGPRAAAFSIHPACSRWDEKAADVLARLVHEPGDASLRQAGDAVLRLRRARRNCREGWLALACNEYHAIVRLRADMPNESPMSKSFCSIAMIE
jgi:hypothetical protein